jgi:hypothetical protein
MYLKYNYIIYNEYIYLKINLEKIIKYTNYFLNYKANNN